MALGEGFTKIPFRALVVFKSYKVCVPVKITFIFANCIIKHEYDGKCPTNIYFYYLGTKLTSDILTKLCQVPYKCPQNTEKYHTLKNNIRMKCIILEAKLNTQTQFIQLISRLDIKWQGELFQKSMCISNDKRKETRKLFVDFKIITDKGNIYKSFNNSLYKYWTKISWEIDTENKQSVHSYFKNWVLSSFTFSFVDHNTISGCISHLASNNSSCDDGIFLRLFINYCHRAYVTFHSDN